MSQKKPNLTLDRAPRGESLLARCALAFVVLGVPCVLLRLFGTPGGTLWEMVADHRLSARIALAPSVIESLAVVVAWLVWLWMIVALVLEYRFRRTGHLPAALPFSRRLQGATSAMVGAALAVTLASRVPSAHVAQASPASPVEWSVKGGDRSTVADAMAMPDQEAPEAPLATSSSTGPALHVVSERETLWSIAEAHLGAPQAWSELAAHNYGRVQADGQVLDEEHWIRPGWVLELPTRPRPQLPDAPLPLGAGVVGVGVVDVMERLRAIQQRYRRTGELTRMSDATLHPIERRLRAGDGRSLVDALVGVIRDLERAGERVGLPLPPVVGVHIGPQQIEVVTHRDARFPTLPPPWMVEDQGRRCVIDRRSTRRGRQEAPLADGSFVCVGRRDEGAAFVNVAAMESLAVKGEAPYVEDALRVLALELATSRWSINAEVVVVGFGAEFRRLPGVRCLGAGDEPLGEVARGRHRIIVCGPDVPPANCEAFLGRPQTTVVGPMRKGRYEFCVSALASIDDLADCLTATGIDKAELSEVVGALSVAADRESVAEITLPLVVNSRAPEWGGVEERANGVQVEVLGPVRITGAVRPFTRAWAKELVVYLAMHPDGAANDIWATALWPERVMAPASLHSTASVARRSLGVAEDGSDHLPRSHGRLQLGPGVTSDWIRFLRGADRGDEDGWVGAVSMLRGSLFDGLKSSDWTVLEGIAPSMEAKIVDVAGRLAGSAFRRGDATLVEWSARKGLLVSPYDERLYRMLLRAADLAGNPAGVESVMEELVSLVADGLEPWDSVHPSTWELYTSLSRRRTHAGPRP